MSHAPITPFMLPVYDLMHRPGEMREREVDAPIPEGFGNAVIAVKDGQQVHIDARLEALHDGILLTAEVETVAEGECIRCLDPIKQKLRVDIAELFAYSFDEAFDYTVVDDHIDLEPLVRDAVVLALPFQPVCRPDCSGLDPETGEKVADIPGWEPRENLDPRWSALAGLASTDTDVAGDTEKSDGTDKEKRS